MQTLESPPSDIDPKRLELIDGPPSNNYNKRQVQLAVEKFRTEQPFTNLNHNVLGDILMAWGDSSEPDSDSKVFAAIAEHPDFKTHPKFRGSVANITLEDMEKPLEELFPK